MGTIALLSELLDFLETANEGDEITIRKGDGGIEIEKHIKTKKESLGVTK